MARETSSTPPKRRGRMSRREFAIYRRCQHWGVQYRHIRRAEIFKRDAWVCQLCLEPIPNGQERKRYPHALSPSVDHKWPLSIPGSPGHVWSNVQAAHFRCNVLKSNRQGYPLAEAEDDEDGLDECGWIDGPCETENPY